MTQNTFSLIIILIMSLLTGCIEEKDTDAEKPKVELLSPLPCDTIYFGQPFQYQIKITDNSGMGNVSIDIHNNFGHHSHGDHETCNMDEVKDAVAPFSNSWIFSLPEEELEYIFDTIITFPSMKDETTFFDTGDYHFHIYVTDNDGYQVFTTLDVKVLHP